MSADLKPCSLLMSSECSASHLALAESRFWRLESAPFPFGETGLFRQGWFVRPASVLLVRQQVPARGMARLLREASLILPRADIQLMVTSHVGKMP